MPLQQLISPVPPYGFNYQYLNSINSDLALKAAIDPATELELNEARRLNCGGVGTGGYVLFGGGGYAVPEESDQEPETEAEPASSSQPQVIVVQVPAQQSAPQQPTVTQEEQAPLPDQGQFVLVMRDGSLLQAAAFTRTANEIIYITPEGMRRTILLSNLDTDATVRVNSERGTQLQLSL